MALPLPPGLTPPEIAFLCEMELVTVVPRQRLEGLELLGVCAPPTPLAIYNTVRRHNARGLYVYRALLDLSTHLKGATFPYGSPSSSNASAEQTFSHPHGSTRILLPRYSTTRQSMQTHSLHHRGFHHNPQTTPYPCRRPSYQHPPQTLRQTRCHITG